MANCAQAYPAMAKRLAQHFKPVLAKAIADFARENKIKYSRRLVCRSREVCICFFCEHVPNFPEGFPPLNCEQALQSVITRKADGDEDDLPNVFAMAENGMEEEPVSHDFWDPLGLGY
jgi:hypothetical protein